MEVTTIKYWWDRLSRNWIVQAMDSDDCQVGSAEFAANKRTLPSTIAYFTEKYPNTPVVKS